LYNNGIAVSSEKPRVRPLRMESARWRHASERAIYCSRRIFLAAWR